jgi:hypothetical protein
MGWYNVGTMRNIKHASIEQAENGFIVYFREPARGDDFPESRASIYNTLAEAMDAIAKYFKE